MESLIICVAFISHTQEQRTDLKWKKWLFTRCSSRLAAEMFRQSWHQSPLSGLFADPLLSPAIAIFINIVFLALSVRKMSTWILIARWYNVDWILRFWFGHVYTGSLRHNSQFPVSIQINGTSKHSCHILIFPFGNQFLLLNKNISYLQKMALHLIISQHQDWTVEGSWI